MAVENKRGCGYRKVGGLYMVASGAGRPSGRLPLPLNLCPTCGAGIKQTHGWTWVDAAALLGPASCNAPEEYCATCPASQLETIGRAGLLWVGAKFYPAPADFTDEANELGISKRIQAIPRGFELGKTWVLLAHPKAFPVTVRRIGPAPEGSRLAQLGLAQELPSESTWTPGVFRIFRPHAFERIVTESQSKDSVFMAALAKRGETAVVVPDHDADHQGSVFDPESEEQELPLSADVN